MLSCLSFLLFRDLQWVFYESCWHLVDAASEPEWVDSLKDIAKRLLAAFEGEG
jgi:hypothetical protein